MAVSGTCRVCLSSVALGPSGQPSPMLYPCRCKGTQGGQHAVCLARWLEISGRHYCELCRYAYQIDVRPISIWTLIHRRRLPHHPIRLLVHILYSVFIFRRTLQLLQQWWRHRRPFAKRLLLTFLIGHSCVFLVADAKYISNEMRNWARQEACWTIVDDPFGNGRRVELP